MVCVDRGRKGDQYVWECAGPQPWGHAGAGCTHPPEATLGALQLRGGCTPVVVRWHARTTGKGQGETQQTCS